jgi:hypothetical protein
MDNRFEEWVGHPNKRTFVPVEDHFTFAHHQGWWASGWRGTAAEVKARKFFYKNKPLPADILESETW